MNGQRLVFGSVVTVSLLLVALSLHTWGAAEIQKDGSEVIFLTFAAAFWLLLATILFSWFGLSYRDDVRERKNAAALVALCGAELAAAIIYIGGSVGEGPSYSNNVFSIALGAAGFFAAWIVFEIFGRVSISIAEERDLASGVRMCGFLLAIALVLGRAIAGDWHSESATIHDFIHDGWPVVVICAGAVPIEYAVRPCRERPFPAWPKYGLLPALSYLALTALWLCHLGAWEGMHR